MQEPDTSSPSAIDVALWHALERAAVESRLSTRPTGLTQAESAERLQQHGPNRLEETPLPSDVAILLNQFRSPLIYILLIAGAVTIAISEYIDAGVIAAVLALNAAIGFTQERRAERSVRALMGLLAPRAHVVRDGVDREIESAAIVPGDVVLLESGRRVPADIRLFETTALAVDESLLTGESLPVAKRETLLDPETGLADRANMTFTGAVVTSGRGRGYVAETGPRTELGRIAESVRGESEVRTPLQLRMDRFAKIIGLVVAVSAAVSVGIGVAIGEPLADMVLVAVALAVAAVPEGLPVVFTITLALGVGRMARRRAIVRRLPAVETLGSTTVIGSDKTGTLTENRMTVQEVWAAGETWFVPPETESGDPHAMPDALRRTLIAGCLANEASIRVSSSGIERVGDPTEAALLVAAHRFGLEPGTLRLEHELVAEVPFEPERQYSASVRMSDDGLVLSVKGAPERIVAMCDRAVGGDGHPGPLDREAIHRAADAMARRGLRVLAMAYRHLERAPDPDELREAPDGLVFAGLQGMMDPPREGVKEAIAGCRAAGMRVVMITGDHAATADAIGRELGIAGDAPALTGVEIARLDDEELRDRVGTVAVYARVSPDQKLRIVRALQARGEVVAVTGDGVNDAPALKAAQIGVAMGKGGTDIAREAADIVLVDDNFVSIYDAVAEGRVTFDNLRKVTFFLISTGAAAIIMILSALVAGWPLPMLPAQLLWLNLVTNGLQDVALAFEPGEPEALLRPPRPRSEGVISALLWERTVIAGLVMAAGTLAMFRWELDATGSLPAAQTVALTTMVIFQAFQAGNARSEHRSLFRMSPWSNRFLFLAVAGAVALHALALYLPPTQLILRVQPIEPEAWVRIVLVALSLIVAMELHKLVRRRWPIRGHAAPAAVAS